MHCSFIYHLLTCTSYHQLCIISVQSTTVAGCKQSASKQLQKRHDAMPSFVWLNVWYCTRCMNRLAVGWCSTTVLLPLLAACARNKRSEQLQFAILLLSVAIIAHFFSCTWYRREVTEICSWWRGGRCNLQLSFAVGCNVSGCGRCSHSVFIKLIILYSLNEFIPYCSNQCLLLLVVLEIPFTVLRLVIIDLN